MSDALRILVTNDDGVDAPGLEVMLNLARAISDDVTVVAPASNQSGVGHRISFGHELQLERRDRDVFALEGTPADCVIAGCTHLLADRRPDVVLSGVNNGQNVGDVTHASGTLAGAREGALQGALGIAMSQSVDYERNHDVVWDCARDHGLGVLNWLIGVGRKGAFYNVNLPLGRHTTPPRLAVVPAQRFSRSPFAYHPSRNRGKFFVAVPEVPKPLDPEHDFEMLRRKSAITITPMSLQLTDFEVVDELNRLMRPSRGPASEDAAE